MFAHLTPLEAPIVLLAFAAGIGPLIAYFLPRLMVLPITPEPRVRH